MSSSNGKAFTGTVLGVLALFGIGGYLADRSRTGSEEPQTVQSERGNQVVEAPQASLQTPRNFDFASVRSGSHQCDSRF